ncbi:MAG: hypothetical protein ACLP9L_24905 [Thermoguttaceae bacterium]
MTLDDYEIRIDEIAAECQRDQRSAHEVVYAQPDRESLADLRLQVLNDSDIKSCVDFLSTGLFSGESRPVRLALFLITLEVERQVARLDIRARFVAYEGSPLLVQFPDLRDYVRDDLIVCSAIQQLENSDVVKVPGGFARIDGMLNPLVAAWVLGSYPHEDVRLRLDPREGGPRRLPMRLWEYVVRPPSPTWWRTFGLQRGKTDCAGFELDPNSVPEQLRDAARWEYAAKGIRRLEVFVKRENQGRFSMMVEELSVRDDRNGFILGRCIHLDSRSAEGTPFEKAELDHIDLAINVYQDDKRHARLEQRLCDGGKVVDASFHTHLLRINGPRFPVLFDCAIGFLQSTTLLCEWLRAQFPR